RRHQGARQPARRALHHRRGLPEGRGRRGEQARRAGDRRRRHEPQPGRDRLLEPRHPPLRARHGRRGPRGPHPVARRGGRRLARRVRRGGRGRGREVGCCPPEPWKRGLGPLFFKSSKEFARMAEISAALVKELRELTGLGMMECKKALAEAGGDLRKAEELLRIRSGAKANKAASRIAAEGVIGAYVSPDGKLGALVELNCETDFVAKNEEFVAFARSLAETVGSQNPKDVAALASGKVEERRQALIRRSART